MRQSRTIAGLAGGSHAFEAQPSGSLADPMDMEEKRRSPRVRCQLPCTLRWSGGEASGVVRDVSAGGLAVQTEAELGEGESVRARVEPPLGADVEVEAIVWHAHRVRSRRTGRAGYLLGLVVSKPPESWFDRVGARRPEAEGARAGGGGEAPPADASPECCGPGERSSFVVRLKQAASPRTRAYRVEAASLAEARSLAEAEARDGWHVIEVRAA